MAVYRSNVRNASYYVNGSAVRAPKPNYRPETEPRKRTHVDPENEQRIIRKPRNSKYYAASRSASVSINLPLTVLLVISLIVCVLVGYKYLCIKSSLNTHMDNIKTLETTLDTLRSENDALERSIDTAVDLDKVYEIATKELGMVRVKQDNIILYDKTESEYVKQNEDIPEIDEK